MDNKKQIIFLVIAVIAGGLAVTLVGSYINTSINHQTELLKEEYEAKQKEMVAALQQQNEQRMALLAQQMENTKNEQAQQLAAMQTKLQQAAAQPPKRKKPSLAIKTPAGKRAVTVKIESLSAVGGLLNPGDLVDVIATLNVPVGGAKAVTTPDGTEKKDNVTAMVFQSLQVLAVNTNLEETGVYYDEQQVSPEIKITVAVDPDEAGMLIFADKNGKLQLALRSPQETERQMVKASTWKTLADYVLENQGVQINLPDSLKGVVSKGTTQDKPVEKQPSIQIFRGGKEL